jgi:septum formation protein
MRSLLLASASSYRHTLLSRLGVSFEVAVPQVTEEELPGEPPEVRATRLARSKAEAVSQRYPEALVIGADQVAAVAGRVLRKPGAAARSREQLAVLSGNTASFYTACALLGARARIDLAHLDTTRVAFRRLQRQEIERYVEREQPFDCAGSFKAEALGIALFTRIESTDPTALVGLPLIWLAHALRASGYAVP